MQLSAEVLPMHYHIYHMARNEAVDTKLKFFASQFKYCLHCVYMLARAYAGNTRDTRKG